MSSAHLSAGLVVFVCLVFRSVPSAHIRHIGLQPTLALAVFGSRTTSTLPAVASVDLPDQGRQTSIGRFGGRMKVTAGRMNKQREPGRAKKEEEERRVVSSEHMSKKSEETPKKTAVQSNDNSICLRSPCFLQPQHYSQNLVSLVLVCLRASGHHVC